MPIPHGSSKLRVVSQTALVVPAIIADMDNPKAADRLGVLYTPNEIVRSMVENADRICEEHFGNNLIDKRTGSHNIP